MPRVHSPPVKKKFQRLEKRLFDISNDWNFFARLLALLLCPLAAAGADLFTEREQTAFDRALTLMNVTPADPGFAKDHGEPKLALEWVRSALSDPAAVQRAGSVLWDAAQDASGVALWDAAAALSEAQPPATTNAPASEARDNWEGLDAELAGILSRFMESARVSDRLLRQAGEGLSPEDLGYLAAAALAGAFNAEDEEATRAAIKELGVGGAEVERVLAEARALDESPAADYFLERVMKVQRGALLEAGRIFQRAVSRLTEEARTVAHWPSGNVLLLTDLGKVRITSGGDDSYSDRALLILSPRGRNTYYGEAGVANGLRGQRLAAIVDLDGDDTYRGDAMLGPGSALFGVSVVVDGAGDDSWHAAYAGQAAAFYGVAWVEDLAGQDDYEARALAQGASLLGAAVLHDHAGNDLYQVGLQGQAYASLPGFAALVDRSGADRYYAGGRELDHERNPDRYLSLAQGFAIGGRPFTGGGVAVLADLAGNDTYVADVYGQGVSYYYSAAFLLDGAGHDSYSVHHYGQGAGIHLSHGLLMDLDGNDSYRGGILVQGAAHDYAVGGLLDRAGRDTYVADQNAQGHGMNNSYAWLVDGGGDDVYSARDTTSAQGVGNNGGDRDYGSLALLLDLGGRDVYSCRASNNVPLLRPLYGLLFDRDVKEEAK
jgi:hypothetical protein